MLVLFSLCPFFYSVVGQHIAIMSGKSRQANLSVGELGGLIWLVAKYLPNMVSSGGRVKMGYPTKERKLRWIKVQQYFTKMFELERTVRQLKHHWADVVGREGDLVDHLGLLIGGTVGMSHYIICMCTC